MQLRRRVQPGLRRGGAGGAAGDGAAFAPGRAGISAGNLLPGRRGLSRRRLLRAGSRPASVRGGIYLRAGRSGGIYGSSGGKTTITGGYVKAKSTRGAGIGDGTTWQDSPIFSELKPTTEYSFVARYAETDNYLASPASGPVVTSTVVPFVDVPTDEYYCDAVYWAVKNGITFGTSDSTLSPDADCTRAQNVTFLYRCLGK